MAYARSGGRFRIVRADVYRWYEPGLASESGLELPARQLEAAAQVGHTDAAPTFDPALIVTRLVPTGAAASMVMIMSATAIRSRRYCTPERSKAAVCVAEA